MDNKHLLKTLIPIGLLLTIILIFYLLRFQNQVQSGRFNLLLITIDSLRPDHLSCLGYQRNTSPHIDNLAKEGVIFTQAISQGGESIPSLPSLMTSLYPSQHGVIVITKMFLISVPTLAEVLEKNGYYTGAIVAHELKHTGIFNGFNFIDSRYAYTGDSITQKAVAWLRENKDKRFFLWLHYFDPHEPFLPPPPYDEVFLSAKFKEKDKEVLAKEYGWILVDEKPPLGMPKEAIPETIPYSATASNLTEEGKEYYISQYDGEIRFTDYQLGILLDELTKLGLDEKTLIIFTADHGENLADYNRRFGHGDSLHDVLLKVPLVIKYSKLPKHKIIERQVQLIDIMPTIFDILGIKEKIKIEGTSLVPLILDREDKVKDYAFSGSLNAKSIRTEDWKLVYYLDKNRYELYNLKSDPKERHNLIDLEKKEFKLLQAELKKWMKRVRPKESPLGMPLDEDTKQKLRSLGYTQ